MILTDDRSDLEEALNEEVSICILVGTVDSIPGQVHTCMDNRGWGDEPWNRWFLVTDSSLLTNEEKHIWLDQDSDTGNDYAFLGRTTKEVSSRGLAATDLITAGNCDFFIFIDKFAEADLK